MTMKMVKLLVAAVRLVGVAILLLSAYLVIRGFETPSFRVFQTSSPSFVPAMISVLVGGLLPLLGSKLIHTRRIA